MVVTQGELHLHEHRAGRRCSSRTPRRGAPQAQRLNRVFGIDIETCPACGGAVRIIACMEDPNVIVKTLTDLDMKGRECKSTWQPPRRALPQQGLFDFFKVLDHSRRVE